MNLSSYKFFITLFLLCYSAKLLAEDGAKGHGEQHKEEHHTEGGDKLDKNEESSQESKKGKVQIFKPFKQVKQEVAQKRVTVCTQNLENFGILKVAVTREPELTQEGLETKLDSLVRRFKSADCDVIAVQELLGDQDQATTALESLIAAIKTLTYRTFAYTLGDTNELSRVAYLYAEDKFEYLNHVSYNNLALPKLIPEDKELSYDRPPLELQLKSKYSDGFLLTLINFHFKSKRHGWKDPAGLNYETVRMQMAEGLRRMVAFRHRDLDSPNSVVMMLGDRNSHYDSASSRLLTGDLSINAFRTSHCRVGQRGIPYCKEPALEKGEEVGYESKPLFFSPIILDPQISKLPGSYTYQNISYFLDDILVANAALPLLLTDRKRLGDYNVGLTNKFQLASDHAMLWARLTLP